MRRRSEKVSIHLPGDPIDLFAPTHMRETLRRGEPPRRKLKGFCFPRGLLLSRYYICSPLVPSESYFTVSLRNDKRGRKWPNNEPKYPMSTFSFSYNQINCWFANEVIKEPPINCKNTNSVWSFWIIQSCFWLFKKINLIKHHSH